MAISSQGLVAFFLLMAAAIKKKKTATRKKDYERSLIREPMFMLVGSRIAHNGCSLPHE